MTTNNKIMPVYVIRKNYYVCGGISVPFTIKTLKRHVGGKRMLHADSWFSSTIFEVCGTAKVDVLKNAVGKSKVKGILFGLGI